MQPERPVVTSVSRSTCDSMPVSSTMMVATRAKNMKNPSGRKTFMPDPLKIHLMLYTQLCWL